MLIEQAHYVHPDDVKAAGQLRNPQDEHGPRHPDYVAQARDWLGQYLVGEYNRLAQEDLIARRTRYNELRAQGMGHDAATQHTPPRYTGHSEPVITPIKRAHKQDGVSYKVGWIGTLDVHEAEHQDA